MIPLGEIPHQVPFDQESSLEPVPEHDYRLLSSPEIRAKYLQFTDALVGEMARQGTDVAIFLDKSARPVAWMIKELWETLAPHGILDETPMPRPAIKFLNIDREQWGAVLGRSEDKEGGIDISRLPTERLEELKNTFAPISGHSDEQDQSLLTGKKVLVIDELRTSGDTAAMSEGILRMAFPDAKEIKKVYWMGGHSERKQKGRGEKTNTQRPIWYSDTEITGRLVGNRDTSKSRESNSSRQREGRYWLSAPFREPDQKGLQLKKEVKWLAQDVKNHKLLYIPAASWPAFYENIVDRIERIDGITLDEYKRIKGEIDNNKTPKKSVSRIYVDYMRHRKNGSSN